MGYSQALVQIEEHGTYPLHVRADSFEERVIEYEPDDQSFIDAAINSDSERLVSFAEFVEEEATRNALTNRFGVGDEDVERIVEEGLSKER